MKQVQIKKLVKEGHIQILINLQVQGNNSEAIDKATRKQIDEIVLLGKELRARISSPELIDQQKNWFSQYAEIEMLLPNSDIIFDLLLDYMITNIEILAPKKIELKSETHQDRLNDLILKFRESEKTILILAARRKMLEAEVEELKKPKSKKKKSPKSKE
ncbi:MAG: hypothetical protein QF460_03140 [Candidatus Nanoarchaeia archaeon]|jgi:hypothetical protein|nr:hypothetical protein [Candidatus Nanoarchaeia archaeon]